MSDSIMILPLTCLATEVGEVLFRDSFWEFNVSNVNNTSQNKRLSNSVIMFSKCHDVYLFLIMMLPYILLFFLKSTF